MSHIELDIPHVYSYLQGVYALLIDEDYIYIGSSKDIRQRFNIWRNNITKDKVKSKYLMEVLPTCKKIKFEIIERVKELDKLRVTEEYFILFINDIDHPHKKRMVLNKNSATLKVDMNIIEKTHPIPDWIPFHLRVNTIS